MISQIEQADCIEWFNRQSPGSIDLVFGSPPYEQARLYLENGENMGIARDTEEWVAWMVEVTRAALRACKGLVAWVVEGQTRNYRYTASPALLMADLCRAGITLRKPPIFKRIGIPGSGGPDWLRNDYEFIICATNGGKLPWSDNTACGHAPKWAPGGEMAHRLSNGARVNQWGPVGGTNRKKDGSREEISSKPRPSHRVSKLSTRHADGKKINAQLSKRGTATSGIRNGDAETIPGHYDPPILANPGNVIECLVGGGVMGSDLCHDNEAPFPESLAEFFIRSFCPEGGTVADCFSGSGTVAAVCRKWGRKFIGCDLRASQVELTQKRIKEASGLFDEVPE